MQDHENPNLLFIGTEFGLFFTVDGGKQWTELTGGLPTISFRDVKIQRRENDLIAGTFGRGIYILDDFSPLRKINRDNLKQEALLFPSRDALWYLPERFHTSTQGDFEFRAENPEFGATFTYYLRDGMKSLSEKREEQENKEAEKGRYPLYPDWETVEEELRESEPSVYLIIKNMEGEPIRKVSANSDKGIHRVTWDLRFPSSKALGIGNLDDSGSMVSPGSYTATLFSNVNGKTRRLTNDVGFKVKPLFDGTVEGGVSPQQRSAMMIDVAELRRRLSTAESKIKHLKAQLESFRVALDRSSAVASDLEINYEKLRKAIFNLEEMISGKRSSRGFGSSPATISSRLSMIEYSRANTWGLTATQTQQMIFVDTALEELEPMVEKLFRKEFPDFKKALLDKGAPWIPDGLIELHSNDSEDID